MSSSTKPIEQHSDMVLIVTVRTDRDMKEHYLSCHGLLSVKNLQMKHLLLSTLILPDDTYA